MVFCEIVQVKVIKRNKSSRGHITDQSSFLCRILNLSYWSRGSGCEQTWTYSTYCTNVVFFKDDVQEFSDVYVYFVCNGVDKLESILVNTWGYLHMNFYILSLCKLMTFQTFFLVVFYREKKREQLDRQLQLFSKKDERL